MKKYSGRRSRLAMFMGGSSSQHPLRNIVLGAPCFRLARVVSNRSKLLVRCRTVWEALAVQFLDLPDLVRRQFRKLVLPCALRKPPVLLAKKAEQVVERALGQIDHIC